MLEFLKLLMNASTLYDAYRKGMLTWKTVVFGVCFVLFLYGTGLPATLLYQKNSEYKWLFITAVTVDAIVVILYFIFGTRWYLRNKAHYDNQASDQTAASADNQN